MNDFLIHKIKNKFQNVHRMQHLLKSLPDGTYRVTIESTDKRSVQQNAWIHAILPYIVQGLRDMGFSEVKNPNDAKAVIKALFFKKKITNGIEEIEVIEGTSQQSKIDFTEKADDIIRWASEYLGINVAPPGKQLEINA